MRPSESTGIFACTKPRVEERVVHRLDAALADDLAGLAVLVRMGLQLALADLAEQAEELGAERALRVAPLTPPSTLKPGNAPGRSCM